MKKKVRLLAVIGMLWSLALAVFVVVIALVGHEGLPALALLGLHLAVFWRMFHLRRWAGVTGTAIVAWSGLAALQMFPLALAMLAVAAYYGTTIRKAWPELLGGI